VFSALICVILSASMDRSLQPVPRLKELRERRGLTQEELATLSGVPRRTIARHEVHPKMRLRRDARVALAKALKVKAHELDELERGGLTWHP
jgi:DNA-binding XRE family transcriptional regulator